MKFTIGNLGVEIILSWNANSSVPPISIAPIAPVTPVVTKPPVKNIRDIVYVITSAFEGGPVGRINYTNLSDNFDGQGYSIGFLQWNVGQDSDRKLFRRLESVYPGVLKKAFGEALYREFISYIDKSTATRLAWVHKAINTSSGKIEPNWRIALLAVCNTPEFQEVQRFYAEEVFQAAITLCKEYGLKTNRALALAYDIRTQNGSISAATKATILAAKYAKEKLLGRTLKESEYLEIIAIKRAEASNSKWVADVKSRKLTIVYGVGTVHGTKFDLSKFGLDDAPFSV